MVLTVNVGIVEIRSVSRANETRRLPRDPASRQHTSELGRDRIEPCSTRATRLAKEDRGDSRGG